MHFRLFLPCVLLVAAAGAFNGCRADNSLGGECTLVKKNPSDAGSRAISILESEINPGLQKDFISFGSIECEDFVCTRDPAFVRAADPNKAALGYCTKACVNDSSCKTGDDAVDKSATKKLVCRALLLDEVTLGQICQSNPADCQTYFGGTSSPLFCARQLNPGDAGTP